MIMNNIFKLTILSFAGVLAFASCNTEPEFEFAQTGPEMTVECDQSALMGGKIDFVIDIKDNKYPLSVVNAKLYWDIDEDHASEVEIRTKTEGTYAGSLPVPYPAIIDDDYATVVFTAVNTHLGKTYDTLYVAVNRPKFESLTIESGDSWRKTMSKVEGQDYVYSYTGSIPSTFEPFIVTPDVDGKGTALRFGWDGTKIALNGASPIPFDIVSKGTITFNTKTFEGTPIIDIRINGVKAEPTPSGTYKAKVTLKKGDKIEFSGVEDLASWYFEPDHFNVKEDGVYFNAVEGFYTLDMNTDYKYVTVRRVNAAGEPATYADERAITVMGWGIAHPVMTNQLAWDTGALVTLAEVEKGVYQFTGIAVEVTDGETVGGRWRYDYVSIKFFGQAGWGDEWGIVTLTEEAQKYLGVYGNVELLKVDEAGSEERHPLEIGATYVMTVTNCSALNSGKFNCTIDFRKL